MKRSVFFLLLLACLALALLSAARGAEPPRLAILTDETAAPLRDLLSAGLSSAKTADPVERAELDGLAVAGAPTDAGSARRALVVARQAKADALLFASVDASDPKRPRLLLRLTKVADGAVRHSIVLPWAPREMAATTLLAARQLKRPLERLSAIGNLPEERSAAAAQDSVELGEWLLKHRLAEEGVQAIEAAIAMGLTDVQTRTRRMWAYGECAYGDQVSNSFSGDFGYSAMVIPTADELSKRLAAAQRACEYALELLAENASIPDARYIDQPLPLALQTFYKAARVLRATVALQAHVELAKPVQSLRALLARMVDKMEKVPDEGERSTAATFKRLSTFRNYKAQYAAFWCEDPESTLAYYRLALAPGYSVDTPNSSNESTEVRDMLLATAANPPYLDRAPVSPKEIERPGPPRLVDWKHRDQAEMTKLWKGFVEELRQSTDLTAQTDGIAFEYTSTVDPEKRKRFQAETVDWLWKHRDTIIESRDARIYSSLRVDVDLLAGDPEFAERFDHLASFLTAAMDRAEWLPIPPIGWARKIAFAKANENVTPDHFRALSEAMSRYRDRARQDRRWHSFSDQQFAPALERLAKRLEPLPKIEITRDPAALPVTMAWVPARRLDIDPGHSMPLHSNRDRPISDGERVFINTPKGVAALDLETLQSSLTPPLPFGSWQPCPTSRDIWASGNGGIMRISREGGEWQKVEIPENFYRLFTTGERLFAISQSQAGCALHELSGTGARLVCSNRRRPPENPMEDDLFSLDGVFPGPNLEPWVGLFKRSGIKGQKFYAVDRPADPVMQFPNWSASLKIDGSTTLLTERAMNGAIGTGNLSVVGLWRVKPEVNQPQLLLYDPTRSKRPETREPRWALPQNFTNPDPGSFAMYSAVSHGDELWILRYRVVNATPSKYQTDFELYGFFPGRKSPVRVPLQFIPSAADLQALQTDYRRVPAEALTKIFLRSDCITATKFGLAIGGDEFTALWIVPWADLKAWVRLHP